MSAHLGHFYDFGPFRVDVSERLLLRGEDVVPLTPKALEMLLVLIEHKGHVFTKEELMKRIWPDSFVEEANLSHNIYKLREALGEGRDGAKYIETLPRRGYRFVAKVTEVQDRGVDLIVEERSRATIVVEEDETQARAIDTGVVSIAPVRALTSRGDPRRFSRKPGLVATAGVVLIGLVIASLYFWRTRESRITANGPALRSIAVLPFKPLVASERDESLEIGMADTLIAKLSRVNQLTVRPTSAVRQYTKLEDEAVRAAQELKVDAVLDGSIQKNGDRLRVTVRLISAARGGTLWTEQFDEKLADIFSVQDSISRRVVAALALQLSGTESNRLARHDTENSDAYQAYLKGRFFWNKRTGEGIELGLQYFQQGIDLDPNYASAYAGLADCYNVYYFYDSSARPQESFAKAQVAALKALELDNTLAEAHASLAYERMRGEFDWPGAEAEFRQAIELNPSYATAHQWYSELLMSTGRLDESLREMRRAQQLDPTSLIISQMLDVALFTAHRTDEALAQTQKTLELNPDFSMAYMDLGFIYLQKGMYRQALSAHRKAVDLAKDDTFVLSVLGHTSAIAGERVEAQKILRQLQELSSRRYVPASHFAIVYAGLGERDRALTWLEKAHAEHDEFVSLIKVFPALDSLHAEPRYTQLLRRMKLPI